MTTFLIILAIIIIFIRVGLYFSATNAVFMHEDDDHLPISLAIPVIEAVKYTKKGVETIKNYIRAHPQFNSVEEDTMLARLEEKAFTSFRKYVESKAKTKPHFEDLLKALPDEVPKKARVPKSE
jgi:hypothetical protein